VSDDQELGVALELVEQTGEPAHVGVVQRGVTSSMRQNGLGFVR
jgi:hypothetical protein